LISPGDKSHQISKTNYQLDWAGAFIFFVKGGGARANAL